MISIKEPSKNSFSTHPVLIKRPIISLAFLLNIKLPSIISSSSLGVKSLSSCEKIRAEIEPPCCRVQIETFDAKTAAILHIFHDLLTPKPRKSYWQTHQKQPFYHPFLLCLLPINLLQILNRHFHIHGVKAQPAVIHGFGVCDSVNLLA